MPRVSDAIPDRPAAGRARGVVLAWMPVSQRSRTLAERLGFELHLVGRRGFRRAWTAPLTYPLSIVRTLATLARRRPRAIVVVAPPFVAPLVVLPIAAMLGARWAVDVHTGALVDRRWRWSVPILAWISRRSAAAVVTLPSLAAILAERGAPVLVLPDPLPRLRPTVTRDRIDRSARMGDGRADGAPADPPAVVAVTGWGDDEPLEALVAAAEGRPWQLVLTGRPRRPLSLPSNVRLAGFLDDEAYVDLLAAADAVVVLTRRDQTLLSGGWEAIALERPLILSGTPAIRATFGDSVTLVDDTSAGIAAGIDATLGDAQAPARMTAVRARFERDNDVALDRLAAALGVDR
jgi:glycosyltransferase involved in cell wall biosynthesis